MDRKRKRAGGPSSASNRDFNTSKSRLGKKKLKAANHTYAEVRAKPVKVIEQKKLARYDTKGVAVTGRNLTLNELISQVRKLYFRTPFHTRHYRFFSYALFTQTNHHNGNTRRDAYLGIRELLDQFPQILSPQLGYILTSVAKGATDSQTDVRKQYRHVLVRVLQLLAQEGDGDSGHQTPHKLAPFAERFGQQLRLFMTHRDQTIRLEALSFVELLLSHSAIDSALALRILRFSVSAGIADKSDNKNGNTVAAHASSNIVTADSLDTLATFIADLFERCLPQLIDEHYYVYVYRASCVAVKVFNLFKRQNLTREKAVGSKLTKANLLAAQMRTSNLQDVALPVPVGVHCSLLSSQSLMKNGQRVLRVDPVRRVLTMITRTWMTLQSVTHYSRQSNSNSAPRRTPDPEIDAVLRRLFSEMDDAHHIWRGGLTETAIFYVCHAAKKELARCTRDIFQQCFTEAHMFSTSPCIRFCYGTRQRDQLADTEVEIEILSQMFIPAIQAIGVEEHLAGPQSSSPLLKTYLIETQCSLVEAFALLLLQPTAMPPSLPFSALSVALLSQCISNLPLLAETVRVCIQTNNRHSDALRAFCDALCSVVHVGAFLLHGCRSESYEKNGVEPNPIPSPTDADQPLLLHLCTAAVQNILIDATSKTGVPSKGQKILNNALKKINANYSEGGLAKKHPRNLIHSARSFRKRWQQNSFAALSDGDTSDTNSESDPESAAPNPPSTTNTALNTTDGFSTGVTNRNLENQLTPRSLACRLWNATTTIWSLWQSNAPRSAVTTDPKASSLQRPSHPCRSKDSFDSAQECPELPSADSCPIRENAEEVSSTPKHPEPKCCSYSEPSCPEDHTATAITSLENDFSHRHQCSLVPFICLFWGIPLMTTSSQATIISLPQRQGSTPLFRHCLQQALRLQTFSRYSASLKNGMTFDLCIQVLSRADTSVSPQLSAEAPTSCEPKQQATPQSAYHAVEGWLLSCLDLVHMGSAAHPLSTTPQHLLQIILAFIAALVADASKRVIDVDAPLRQLRSIAHCMLQRLYTLFLVPPHMSTATKTHAPPVLFRLPPGTQKPLLLLATTLCGLSGQSVQQPHHAIAPELWAALLFAPISPPPDDPQLHSSQTGCTFALPLPIARLLCNALLLESQLPYQYKLGFLKAVSSHLAKWTHSPSESTTGNTKECRAYIQALQSDCRYCLDRVFVQPETLTY